MTRTSLQHYAAPDTGIFDFQNRTPLGQSVSEPPERFLPWLEEVTPRWNWRWPHLLYIQDHLERVTTGEITRLMIFLPPRHGKSETATVRYPAYRLERDPGCRVIVGSYNQKLANKFSRKARRIAAGRVELSEERNAAEDWETSAGGGMRAVGVGAGITGQGGDLIVIDDPIKNREEAESEAYRERVWDWYTDDLYTRLEPGAAIILILTRWHEDDLAGRILASEDAPNWTVVSLPAEAEGPTKDNPDYRDPLGRKPGEALCPDRFDSHALANAKRVLGRSFSALYQQRPQNREGEMFKRGWFEIVDKAPKYGKRVRWWDKAAVEGGGNWTAGVKLLGVQGGIVYVEDVRRFQHAAGKRDKLIRETAQVDGTGVEVWGPQDPGQAGKSDAEAFVRLLVGFKAHTRPETGDKETRAEPFASYAEVDLERQTAKEGKVKLVRGDWNHAFLEELTAFNTGKYDDQVDAAANAFSVLAKALGGAIAAGAQLGSEDLAQPSQWDIQ